MEKIFRIKNLCCANCAAKIERAVRRIKGVEDASLSFMAQRLRIVCEEQDVSAIREEILAVAKKIEPDCEIIG